jgi:hypothetical protein
MTRFKLINDEPDIVASAVKHGVDGIAQCP